jgi:hypothetical protein
MLEVIILNYKPISKILLISLGFIIAFSYFFFHNIKDHVMENWVYYRKHPLFIPFAGIIKREKGESVFQATKKNFIKVLWNIVNKFLNILMIPIYPIIKLILKVFGFFVGILNGIRNQITVIRNFLFKLFEKMYIRLQNGIATVIFFFLKLRETMKRSYGLMTVLLYAIEHSFIFFESMVKSPLRKFGDIAESTGLGLSIFTFGGFGIPMWHDSLCFDENTIIYMSDGSCKKISDVNIGDYLINTNKVLATIKVNNIKQIYKFKNILVKGDHLIYHNNKWSRIADISDSEKILDYNGNIVCLVTENGIININNCIFKDYLDTHNPHINKTVRKIVNNNLNSNNCNQTGCIDLLAGYPKYTKVTGKIKGYVSIGIGEITEYKYKNTILSGNIIVKENNEWIRVADSKYSFFLGKNTEKYVNYITEDNIVLINDRIIGRDFVEIGDPFFNSQLDAIVDKLIEKIE